ncbi:MAG: hypothetical protein R6U50_13525 [Desulfobacterales bacterium]
MEIKNAVTALIQSDKIKSGIIWTIQLVNMLSDTGQNEKPGAKNMIRTLIGMIGHESVLARRMTRDGAWTEVEKDIDMALVMIDSGVFQEAGFHLGRALRQATGIAGRNMSFLVEKGIL